MQAVLAWNNRAENMLKKDWRSFCSISGPQAKRGPRGKLRMTPNCDHTPFRTQRKNTKRRMKRLQPVSQRGSVGKPGTQQASY
ncbi:hypothetical protein MHYP_G00242480 [Metynnis hypsauchen]